MPGAGPEGQARRTTPPVPERRRAAARPPAPTPFRSARGAGAACATPGPGAMSTEPSSRRIVGDGYDRPRRGTLASPGLCRVEGHRARGPYVDAGRGQDPTGHDAAHEPLVEFDAHGDATRPHDNLDARGERGVPDRLRSHRP